MEFFGGIHFHFQGPQLCPSWSPWIPVKAFFRCDGISWQLPQSAIESKTNCIHVTQNCNMRIFLTEKLLKSAFMPHFGRFFHGHIWAALRNRDQHLGLINSRCRQRWFATTKRYRSKIYVLVQKITLFKDIADLDFENIFLSSLLNESESMGWYPQMMEMSPLI